MRGKFLQTCKDLNSPNNDIKSSLGFFHIKLHFEIFEGFHRERRRKYPHRKFPFISLSFLQTDNMRKSTQDVIPRIGSERDRRMSGSEQVPVRRCGARQRRKKRDPQVVYSDPESI